jgi:exo-beta-1,3-glucanase (GH17 family)/cellulose synthase/poly-beta-1,6-N-acetylglucosamine synthase-like glycosyltransferase
MRKAAIICALVAVAHYFAWALLEPKGSAPAFNGILTSVSYTPFDGSAHPDSGKRTSPSQIRADLTALAPYTRAIRTYSSTGGSELIPGIAADLGLTTAAGAWIDRDRVRNEVEIGTVIELASQHRSITSVVVGNETIYRADQTVSEIIEKIKRVKREVSVPVTTGEIWNVWLEHPELVEAVDYIAAHVLPYWEGISEQDAVAQALRIHQKLREAYPKKRIVIAEFGWPSAGHNRRAANPGAIPQATVMREFLNAARRHKIEYNIIEAYDQPWKTFEGGVGPYWGLFDTSRQPKFSWSGPLSMPGYTQLIVIALAVGALLSAPILLVPGVTVAQGALMAVAANGFGAWVSYAFGFWRDHYFVTGAAIAFGIGMLLLLPLIMTSLYKIEEIAALALGRRPRRLLHEAVPEAGPQPMVSIHIPACREHPDMLKKTLNSVAALDYPNFECIVVVNNTPDPAMWQPIEAHCQALGPQFKFVREDKLEGFKAGALRLALAATSPAAEIIGILDADYVVDQRWLRHLVPAFADPRVGIVQAPQDHRDGDQSLMHQAMDAEYAGFFDIGMVYRNEADGIVVHGTMCLINRKALEQGGSWSSDTICEDTDLGLSIIEKGWTSHYTARRYGRGLLPDTYLAFKRQRYRWAFGGFQIAKKHWHAMLPGRSHLSLAQKHAFVMGWVSWLGAESIGVLLALLNLALVPFVQVAKTVVPEQILTLPILAAFGISLSHFLVLYWQKVKQPPLRMLAALVTAMSVQWTIARAVAKGLVEREQAFVVTTKGGRKRLTSDFPAFWETSIGLALSGSALLIAWTNWERVSEIYLFAGVLAVQSLPFLAATAIALLERSRVNDPVFWRAARRSLVRTVRRVPRRAPGRSLPAGRGPSLGTEVARDAAMQ